ncbi:MAG: 23S rRNA (pseudouridine(1915)-N(3))-methyltransferase RlmH, partial [Mucinivorans sp.]
GAKNMSQPQIKEAEGEQIVARFLPSDTVVLLDEGGEQLSSEGLADFLQSTTLRTARRVVFVVGGAYGFSQKVYHRANKKLSLSRMTFSHQMVRLIFLEQLYRAHTIIKGEPYHHS